MDNKTKLLNVFFDDPLPEYQLRELSRKIRLAPTSVKIYLNELEKEGLVKRSMHRIHKYPVYKANWDGADFHFLKKQAMIRSIKDSGLLKYLQNTCTPDVAILFGSCSKGEDLKNSDIDIFLLSENKKLELNTYEKRLNRKINVFFSENFGKHSKEFKNNVINGVILSGYLKVF